MAAEAWCRALGQRQDLFPCRRRLPSWQSLLDHFLWLASVADSHRSDASDIGAAYFRLCIFVSSFRPGVNEEYFENGSCTGSCELRPAMRAERRVWVGRRHELADADLGDRKALSHVKALVRLARAISAASDPAGWRPRRTISSYALDPARRTGRTVRRIRSAGANRRKGKKPCMF